MPTEYAEKQHRARCTLVLAVLALPVKHHPMWGQYRVGYDITERLRRQFHETRTLDWINRHLRELYATGHVDRRVMPGHGRTYGWQITELGRDRLEASIDLLPDGVPALYAQAMQADPR